MPHAIATDGTKLYFEDSGTGQPILFLHEYAGDHRSWEGQVAALSSDHRCIVCSARGYPPSDVPSGVESYGQDIAIADAVAVLDHLAVDRAFVVGLSMGAYTGLRLALEHPDRVIGLIAASGGAGSFPDHREAFIQEARLTAAAMERAGAVPADALAGGPSRVQLRDRNRAEWEKFRDQFAEHPATGAAHTLRGVQAGRPSLFDFKNDFRECMIPTLLLVGDEDEACLDVNLFLKRTMPMAGLRVFAKSGHLLNLEDPETFNAELLDFFAAVTAGVWKARSPEADPSRGTLSGERA